MQTEYTSFTNQMKIGFSTGSLALDDVREGLRIATHGRVKAIELSALREDELRPLVTLLDSIADELRPFEYIAFHAPSRRKNMTEMEFVAELQKVAKRGWAIIVHPDIFEDVTLWRPLGNAVCIENMDKRKSTGRTANELRNVFDQLPDATFCFDIGHAKQIDSTMMEARKLLEAFGHRLRQLNVSYVNSSSRLERLNRESIIAFQRVADLIPRHIPVILETPVTQFCVDEEIDLAESIWQEFGKRTRGHWPKIRANHNA